MPASHEPVIRPRSAPSGSPLPDQLVEALHELPIAELSDIAGPLFTMDRGIVALRPHSRRVVGSAVTVRAPYGDNWAIYGGLSRCGSGHVLVVDWCGYHEGCGGGAVALRGAAARGLAGVVIDGAWRDMDEVAELGVAVYGRGVSSLSPPKSRRGEVNLPASCGRVVVGPGDAVVADPAGVVVLPRDHLGAVQRRLDRGRPASADVQSVEQLTTDYWSEEGEPHA